MRVREGWPRPARIAQDVLKLFISTHRCSPASVERVYSSLSLSFLYLFVRACVVQVRVGVGERDTLAILMKWVRSSARWEAESRN